MIQLGHPFRNRHIQDLTYKRISVGNSHCLAIAMVKSNKGEIQVESFGLYGWGSNENGQLGARIKVQEEEDEEEYEDDLEEENGEDDQNKEEGVEEEVKPSGKDLDPDQIQVKKKKPKPKPIIEPVRIRLVNEGAEYIPLQVSCGAQHSIVVAIKKADFLNYRQENKSIEATLQNTQLIDNHLIFSAGLADNYRLGRQRQVNDQEEVNQSLELSREDNIPEDEYQEDDDLSILYMTRVISELQSIVMISCGSSFTLALDNYGTVISWGEGSFGALGTGITDDCLKPTMVPFDNQIRIKFIAAGTGHAAAISEAGILFTWGLGQFGQLGQGDYKNQNSPKDVGGSLLRKTVEYVSCGGMHTVCVTADGYAHSFGLNKNGQLGTGDYESRCIPDKIQHISNFFVIYAECGINTTFLVTEERLVFSFGCNLNGRLGLEDFHTANLPTPSIVDMKYFDNIINQKSDFIYQITLSLHFGAALTEGGHIITWGLPIRGCLGRDMLKERIKLQESKGSYKNILNATMDEDFENDDLATKTFEQEDKTVLSILTHPSKLELDNFVPLQNEEFKKKLQKGVRVSQHIEKVKCGLYHTVALTDMGELWVWGSNNVGQHGIDEPDMARQEQERQKITKFQAQQLQPQNMPTQVALFNIKENRRITYFSTGYEYVVIVENRRSIYSWGRNHAGQLGLGYVSEFVSVPNKVSELEGMLIKQVACGEEHTLILNDEGFVFSFGSPTEGKLGLGEKQTQQLYPTQIQNLKGVIEIVAGPSHSMALAEDPLANERVIPVPKSKDDKSNEHVVVDNQKKFVVYTWGSGYAGKLGHGNHENINTPKMLQTKYQFKQIACGTNHSGAITTDNKIVVWGYAAYLGVVRPDVDESEKLDIKQQQGKPVQPYYITTPSLHKDFTNEYNKLCLGDKFNMALTTQSKIIFWGLFDFDFQKKMATAMQGKDTNQSELIREGLLTKSSYYNLDARFIDISCSFNQAVAISKQTLDIQTVKYDIYSWGLDGMTGRLGLGYKFFDPEQENQIQLEDGNMENIDTTIKDIISPIHQPTQLSFIAEYLDDKFKQFQQQQAKQQLLLKQGESKKKDFEESKADEGNINSVDEHKDDGRVDFIQLGKSKKKKACDPKINLAYALGIATTSILDKSEADFLRVTKPELFRGIVSLRLFDEYKLSSLYEAAINLESEIQDLYKKYQAESLESFKQYTKNTVLTILKKIQGEPFNIQFKPKHHTSVQKKALDEQYTNNKYAYRILFTLLQIHPCYLINMYKLKLMPPDDFVSVVQQIYGDMQIDKRKSRTFVSLALEILAIDLRQANSSALVFSYQDKDRCVSYVFMRLYMGYQAQFEQNIRLNLKLQEQAEKVIEAEIYGSNNVPKNMKNYQMGFLQEHLKDEIKKRNLDLLQIRRLLESQVDFLQKFMKTILTGIKNIICTKPHLKIDKRVQEFTFKAYNMIKNKFLSQNSEETFQSVIVGLYFQNFLKEYSHLKKQIDLTKQDLDDDSENRELNRKCLCDLLHYLFSSQYFSTAETPYLVKLEDFVSDSQGIRKSSFEVLVKPNKNTLYKDNSKKVKDIYYHSMKTNDDVISPTINTIVLLTKIIEANDKKISTLPQQDNLLNFAKLIKKEEINYLKVPPNPANLNTLVQMYYAKKSIAVKMCGNCECYLVESFLRSNDPFFLERFENWNPASLESFFVRIAPSFQNKKELDDFLNGQVIDLGPNIEQKKQKMKAIQKFDVMIYLTEFQQAFENHLKYIVDANENLDPDERVVFERNQKKQILKNLKINVELKLLSIYKYIYNLEQRMDTLYKVYNKLSKKVNVKHEEKQLLYKRIQSNCFFGLSNKEIEKPLEHNPFAMISKVRDAILQIPTSREIFENIDVFKPNRETPVRISMFGAYPYKILTDRDIVDGVDTKLYDVVRKLISNTRFSQTKIIIFNIRNNQIEDNLHYTFQITEKAIQITLIYKENQVSVKEIISCGLLKDGQPPLQLIIEQFEVPFSKILNIRKNIIHSSKRLPFRTGKYTDFNQEGLFKLLDTLQNHCSIYDHVY